MKVLTLAVCAVLLLTPASAFAGDANSTPPVIHLWGGGAEEGLIGPLGKGLGYNESVAYFETVAPSQSWEYRRDSTVSFSCFLDGQPIGCKAEQEDCCLEGVVFAAQSSEPAIPRKGYGVFHGEIPAPADLASGQHSVSVVATDEDGTDPSPPSTTVFMDRTPPTAPHLIKRPARVSRNHKPRFRYVSTDNKGFPSRTYTSTELFEARLRRLRPKGPPLGKGDPFGNYLEWRGPYCPTALECTETDFAAYSASAGNGSTFGIAERLNPGLYEFEVHATDSVGNQSPRTHIRFTVLGARR